MLISKRAFVIAESADAVLVFISANIALVAEKENVRVLFIRHDYATRRMREMKYIYMTLRNVRKYRLMLCKQNPGTNVR